MKAASRLAGRGETFVRDILQRDHDPAAEHLDALARALGTTSGALLGSEDRVGEAPAEGRQSVVPIMGYIGAGSEIEPEFEQSPPEGYSQVELPFTLPAEMVGFEVTGTSMMPAYDAGDVVVCYREQRRSVDSLLGKDAVVRTADGMRYLKRIARGAKRGTYNLESWNAPTIEGAVIEWVGEIIATVAADAWRRIDSAAAARSPSSRAQSRSIR